MTYDQYYIDSVSGLHLFYIVKGLILTDDVFMSVIVPKTFSVGHKFVLSLQVGVIPVYYLKVNGLLTCIIFKKFG